MLDTRVLVIVAAAVCGIAAGGMLVKHFGLGPEAQTGAGSVGNDAPVPGLQPGATGHLVIDPKNDDSAHHRNYHAPDVQAGDAAKTNGAE